MAIHELVVEVYARLQIATSLQIDGCHSPVMWATAAPTGDDDNQIAHLAWTRDGVSCAITLSEGGVAQGALDGAGQFRCVDTEGDPVHIQFFDPAPLGGQTNRSSSPLR